MVMLKGMVWRRLRPAGQQQRLCLVRVFKLHTAVVSDIACLLAGLAFGQVHSASVLMVSLQGVH
jgi:hypothetical protein